MVNVASCFNQHSIANADSGVYPCLNNTDTPKCSFFLAKNKLHVRYKDYLIKLCEEIIAVYSDGRTQPKNTPGCAKRRLV
jgi:hypothetical protein